MSGKTGITYEVLPAACEKAVRVSYAGFSVSLDQTSETAPPVPRRSGRDVQAPLRYTSKTQSERFDFRQIAIVINALNYRRPGLDPGGRLLLAQMAEAGSRLGGRDDGGI